MSDTADSTLNALKALIAAFQTGATPVTVKTSTAEAASLPPKFPGPDDEKEKTPADNSYARQYLEGYVKESEHPSDKKTEPGCPASLHTQFAAD